MNFRFRCSVWVEYTLRDDIEVCAYLGIVDSEKDAAIFLATPKTVEEFWERVITRMRHVMNTTYGVSEYDLTSGPISILEPQQTKLDL